MPSGGRHRLTGFDGIAAAGTTLVAGRLSAKLVDVATLVVLGRILGPADFGLVALAMVFVLIAEGVTEVPVSAALVRERTLPRVLFDTAFTLSLLRGVLVAFTLGLLTWPAARVLDEPRLSALMPVLALAPIARGLFSPRLAVYARRYDHRAEFVLELLGKLGGFCLAVSVALGTESYWAIAVGTVSAPVLSAALSYRLAPYVPRLRLLAWRRFAGFFGWNSAAQAISTISWQMDRLLLGLLAPPALLGRYAVAASLASTVHQAVAVPIGRPLTAAFSMSRTADASATAYLAALRGTALVVAPVAVALSLCAKPIVATLLGEGWEEAGTVLRWLPIAGLGGLLAQPAWALAVSVDRTAFLARKAALELVVRVAALSALLVPLGMMGAVVAQAMVVTAGSACAAVFARTVLGLTVISQLRQLFAPVLGIAAMASTFTAVVHLLGDGAGSALASVKLCSALGAAGVAYLAVVSLTWRASGRPDGIEQVVARLLVRVVPLRSPA